MTQARKWLGRAIRRTTLDVVLGSIAEKPGVVDGRIEIREYLCLTLMFDHDMVEGAPAIRFAARFKDLIESAYGLCELQGNDLKARLKYL